MGNVLTITTPGASLSQQRMPGHLLEPGRLLRDEGLKGTVRFTWNIVRDRESCIFPCAVKRSLELAS